MRCSTGGRRLSARRCRPLSLPVCRPICLSAVPRIGSTPGLENDGLKDFFKSPFTYTLAQITGPIFDFGRKKRKYQAMIAAYDQSRLDYEKAVIGAFTEVNTARPTISTCSMPSGVISKRR